MKALVVGYGSIGERHVKNLLAISDIEVIICTKRKNVKNIGKNCKVYSTITECLKEKPNFAIISNESSLHIRTAKQLAKHGIDIFIEKPLSNSMNGIKQIQDIIQKKKLVTLIGCNLRFHKGIQKIKEIISSNEIGKVISIHAENGSYMPDWHPYENYRDSYASRNDLGGGVVLTCIHEIDYLYWMFGDVKEVVSMTGRYSDLKITADDLSSIIMKFKNNIVAEVHLDYFQHPTSRTCKIIGTKGTVYWDFKDNKIMMYNADKKKWMERFKLENYDNNSMYVDEISYYIDCVKNRKKTINTISDGIKTLKIALAIIKSSKTKKVEKI